MTSGGEHGAKGGMDSTTSTQPWKGSCELDHQVLKMRFRPIHLACWRFWAGIFVDPRFSLSFDGAF